MALTRLHVSRLAKPISFSPVPRLIRIFILTLSFSLYTIVAITVYANQAVKPQGNAAAVDSGRANTDKRASKEMHQAQKKPTKLNNIVFASLPVSDFLKIFIGAICTIVVTIITIIIKNESKKKQDAQVQKNEAKRYSDRLKNEFLKDSIIEIPGIDGNKTTVNPIDTFIDIDLIMDTPEKQKFIDAIEHAVSSKSRMLLIKGVHGSGKTTIIKYFALKNEINLYGFAVPLPILYMPLHKMDTQPESINAFSKQLSECFGNNFSIKEEFLNKRLDKEKTLVLLDGLDEINDNDQRKRVCAWVYDASKTWEKAFFIITTRDKGYGEQEQNALGTDKQIANIQPFTEDQKSRFLQKCFFAHVLQAQYSKENYSESQSDEKADEATEYAHALGEYLSKLDRNEKRHELAVIPMFLHLMVIFCLQTKIMPNESEKLYDIFLDYLIFYRENEQKNSLQRRETVSKKLLGLILKTLSNCIHLPSGGFTMGSPEGESGHESREKQHQIEVSEFFMCKYTVTLSDFQEFTKYSQYETDAEKKDKRSLMWENSEKHHLKKHLNWHHDVFGNPREKAKYNHPVVYVSWNDAKAYCDWLSEKSDIDFRLPTEAEWEYASRAGGTTYTPFSTGENLTTAQANYDGNNPYNGNDKGIFTKDTVPVDTFAPNALGFYNMHGNVWEWCSDGDKGTYNEECKSTDWVNSPVNNPVKGSYHAIRGGGWTSKANGCRSGYCKVYDNVPSNNIGFRVVFVSKVPPKK